MSSSSFIEKKSSEKPVCCRGGCPIPPRARNGETVEVIGQTVRAITLCRTGKKKDSKTCISVFSVGELKRDSEAKANPLETGRSRHPRRNLPEGYFDG